jgi:hypothetical protein
VFYFFLIHWYTKRTLWHLEKKYILHWNPYYYSNIWTFYNRCTQRASQVYGWNIHAGSNIQNRNEYYRHVHADTRRAFVGMSLRSTDHNRTKAWKSNINYIIYVIEIITINIFPVFFFFLCERWKTYAQHCDILWLSSQP